MKRQILIYGACGGLLIVLLQLVEYRFLVIEHSLEIYGALIAAIFAGVGIWLGLKLTGKERVVVVREVPVPATGLHRPLPADFSTRTREISRLSGRKPQISHGLHVGGAAHSLPLTWCGSTNGYGSAYWRWDLTAMQPQNDRRPWNVRALLESTATPFAIAHYGPRAAIFRQGDPCDSVMHIERGRVWLAVTARSGKEAICDLLDAGAFLGEEALVGCGERRQSATAMTATEVLVVAKAHMIRLLRTQPRLVDGFIAHLLARNTRLEANLTDQIFHSSEQRLAHTLLVLGNCDERRPRRCALPDLPQEIIAEMVGTTRSRVNAFLGKFKKLGFIEEHRGVLHVNPARLHVVPDGDRRIAIAASPAIPQAPQSEERHWPLAG